MYIDAPEKPGAVVLAAPLFIAIRICAVEGGRDGSIPNCR